MVSSISGTRYEQSTLGNSGHHLASEFAFFGWQLRKHNHSGIWGIRRLHAVTSAIQQQIATPAPVPEAKPPAQAKQTSPGALERTSVCELNEARQLPVRPPLLRDALHFILEALIVGISLIHANQMQDREHIGADTLVHVPQIGDVPPAVFGCVMPGQ